MLVISAVELKKLTQQITRTEPDQNIKEMLAKDRDDRYQLSRSRVKNWDNTILGQRRKKLEARTERVKEDETLRIEMDRQNNHEETTRRQKIIDRAKLMQYQNQDSVRAFHSKVLLCQVLKERDLQLKMKQVTNPSKTKESRQRAFQECQDIANQQIKEDAYKQAQDKVKRLQYAREQMIQMKERLYKEQEEKSALIREQMDLVRKDEEHKQELLEQCYKRKTASARLRDERFEQVKEKLQRAEAEKLRDEAVAERGQLWAFRKGMQYELKKEIEKKCDALAKREHIGLVQAKLSTDHEFQLQEKVEKAIRLKDQQAQLEEERKLEKKAFRKAELKTYYTDFTERAKERKKLAEKEDKELLEHYLKEKEEAEKEREEKKKVLLCTGLELQEHHRNQAENIHKDSLKQKTERLEYDKFKIESMQTEDQELKAYMRSVADAPWASDNPRLIKHVHETINRPKTVRYSKEPPNTKERLGFLPGKYRKPELTLAAELGNATVVVCDLSAEESIAAATKKILASCPPVEVLVFNAGGPGSFHPGSLLNLKADALLATVSARSIGPLSLTQHLLPQMIERKKGTVLFTGATAAMRGGANFAFLAVPAFATKALAESMAREFMPQGIHVAHVVLDGVILSETTKLWKGPNAVEDEFLHPSEIASQYVMLHNQPKTAWTFELQLRPFSEKW
ncbi:hypothetical protein HDU98_009745 [Podochytrium sp. JEL0797]|nr:hypothetical protein HDU98_009745 [Podochytrium sp. JEL0797]